MSVNNPKDGIVSARIICRGGLNSAENYLELSTNNPGAATKLTNYETSVYGGYRRINGYTALDEEVDPAGAEGGILGIVVFNDTIIVARKQQSGDTYDFYEWTNPGWSKITTGFVRSTTDGQVIVRRIRTEVFNIGELNHIIFVDGVNPALIFNGTDWNELTSSGTGGELDPGGDQITDKPSLVTSFKNHIFLSGDHETPSTIVYSAPNDPYTYTVAAGGGQQKAGMPVLQIKPFRDEIYVFGREKIKKVVTGSTDDAPFLINEVTNNIGCTARDSVIELAGSLLFLAPDGIRPIAGTERINDVEINSVSQAIQSLIIEVNDTYDLSFLSAVVIRSKSQFRYFFSDDSFDTETAKGLLGSFRPRDNPWEFSELLGIRASCAYSGYLNGEEIILHGDYDGVVYQQEVGNSFHGSDITSIYTTPYIDFGDTEVRKVAHEINTFVRLEGNLDMAIGINYDWNLSDVSNPSDYNINKETVGKKYDDILTIYDDSSTVYALPPENVIKTKLQGSFFSSQFTFITIGQEAPHTILGHVLELAPQGRD